MAEILTMLQGEPSKTEAILKDNIWGTIKEFLNLGIHVGEGDSSIHITIGLFLMLTLSFIVTYFALKWLRKLFTRKMPDEDKQKFISIFKFINYFVYIIVVLVTISAAGINITILITASAALFVGLGLALQELFQDVIGGVFIILDKSLSVGDIVEVDNKVGRVFEIKLRTTRAITRDDKVIIIPNHHFISDIIYNYTQNHRTTRESVNVGVAYGSDVLLVTRILEEAAMEQKGVLPKPKPFVLFEDFGDSSLLFSIQFYVNDSFSDPKIKSAVRYAIDAKFRAHQISIPFPQRDVHIFENSRGNG